MASSGSSSSSNSSATAPWEVITDTDQGGLVGILTAFSLSLVLVSLPIRTYVRSKMRTYKKDDYAFLAASAFSVGQAAAVFYQLHIGLGKSDDLVDPNNLEPMEKAAYASDILYIFALTLSKLSTAFLFLRLTPGRGHSLAIWFTIWTCVAWAITSTFLIAIRCHPGHPWTDIDPTCTNLFVRWQFIGAWDMITEIALFAISVYVVWSVQMAHASKAIVIGAFGCRLPVIAVIGLRLHYLNIEILSPNPTLLAVPTVACTQIEIGYSIMASIVPCLKTFMAPYEGSRPNSSKYLQSSNGTNYNMSPLASKSNKEVVVPDQSVVGVSQVDTRKLEGEKRGSSIPKGGLGRLRPEQTVYQARVTHDPSDEQRKSLDSSNSQRMIIKKGVEWAVDYESRNGSSRGGG